MNKLWKVKYILANKKEPHFAPVWDRLSHSLCNFRELYKQEFIFTCLLCSQSVHKQESGMVKFLSWFSEAATSSQLTCNITKSVKQPLAVPMVWFHILCNVVWFLKVQLQSHMIYTIVAFIGIKVVLTLGFAENTLNFYPKGSKPKM